MTRWARRLLAGFVLASLAGWLGRHNQRKNSENAGSEGARPQGSASARAAPRKRAAPPPGPSRESPSAPLPRGLRADSPWASREACLARVRAGARLPRAAERARLVAWNIRWFPDGGPGKSESEQPTDIEWLACALAYLNADVVALEEVKAYPRALQKLAEVRARLDRWTGGKHQAHLDDCEPVAAQHVGLLWNEKRVKAQDFEVFGELNPLASPCQNHLRPGLGARFLFPRGLDLQVVAVHLKSGGEPRARELRARSLERLPAVLEAVTRRHGDGDLLVLGDFNTMGCSSCSPALDGKAERDELAVRLNRASPPLSVLPTKPGCSHYFSGKAGLLDLMVAPRAMRELGAAEVTASGLCGELACAPLPAAAPAAQRDLSDHCPIVVDLLDQDLD